MNVAFSGLVIGTSATEMVYSGSIPTWLKLKKLIFTAFRQQFKNKRDSENVRGLRRGLKTRLPKSFKNLTMNLLKIKEILLV